MSKPKPYLKTAIAESTAEWLNINDYAVVPSSLISTPQTWLPQYEFSSDPCPQCQGQVTGYTANTAGWTTTVTVSPCEHPVAAIVNYESVGVHTYKIHLSLAPPPPTPPTPLPQWYLQGGILSPNEIKQMYGAGYAASGMSGSSVLGQLLSICPGLASVERPCPACTGGPMPQSSLGYLIPHINDTHQWSREKIAEWLDIIAIEDPDVDLTIKPKEQREQPSIGPGPQGPQDYGYAASALGLDPVEYPF